MTDTNADQPLNRKEWAVLYEFLASRDYKQAGLAAGYKEHTARGHAQKILAKPHVRNQLDIEEAEARKRNRITIDRVIEEIAAIATFDPRLLFDSQGDPRPITDLPDSVAAAISGIDVVMVPSAPEEAPGMIRKYKVADKMKALDQLMKHLGGYREDNSQKSESLAEAIEAGRKRKEQADE